MIKISVCMAVYNGHFFLKEQLSSILSQLGDDDEIIISDDGSTDDSIAVISSFDDPRIRLFNNNFRNHILNFEFVLKQARGEYIFLSDQDDVWLDTKVQIMCHYLDKYDLICSNCFVTNSKLQILKNSFYNISINKRDGFLNNLFHNNYLGCCLAFNRKVLRYCLPFPRGLITHDTWIGLVAEVIGNTKFIDDKLIYYRRHNNNTSNTLYGSTLSFCKRINYRFVILVGLIKNIYIKC